MILYKFYIPYFLGTVEVFPVVDRLRFKYSKIEGTKVFRKKLTNKLVFVNDAKSGHMDFDFFYSIETNASLRCTYLEFQIHRSCDNGKSYSLYHTGKITLNSGKWNLKKCTFEVELQQLDKYSCLLENQNKEVNIVEAGPLITIESEHQDIPSAIEFYWCVDGFVLPSPFACVPPTAAVSVYYNALTDVRIYAREVCTTFDIGGVNVPPSSDPAWVLLSGSGTTSTWARGYIGSPVLVTIQQSAYSSSPGVCPYTSSVPSTASGYQPYQLVVQDYEFYNSGLDKYTCQDYYVALPINTINTFTQFRTLYNALNYILQQICPSVSGIVSDFFGWNPIGDAPGYVAGKNYVTGDDNIVAKLAIAQKSDIINPLASQHATIGKITFKQLMKQLNVMFDLWWFIDENNKLRIEHTKYYSFAIGYDTTITPHSIRNGENMEYTYDNQNMPSVERFTFMEAQGMDFVGKDITYSSDCVKNDNDDLGSQEYSADKITTDLNYIDNYPGDITKTGFVLVAYYDNGTSFVVAQEIGRLSSNSMNNGHLSWANLQYNYHRYDRVLIEGYMNGVLETFISSKRIKKQENLMLEVCCGETFEPDGNLITSLLGNGEVQDAEEVNGVVTMSILI